MKNITPKTVFWFGLLTLSAVITRWIPHPSNFTALLAVAIFAPVVLSPRLAIAVVLTSVLLSDLLLGFHSLVPVVYASLLALVFVGQMIPQNQTSMKRWTGMAIGGFLGSALFFITTNLAVWAFSGMYPLTENGLVTCFMLALPFFNNSLVSTFIYLAAFECVRVLVTIRSTKPVPSRA